MKVDQGLSVSEGQVAIDSRDNGKIASVLKDSIPGRVQSHVLV